MSLRRPGLALLAWSLIAPLACAWQAKAPLPHRIDRKDWNAAQEPFRIHGNAWCVGPHGLSSILLDTGKGLVLFDGDLPESAPMIQSHLRALGFELRDVKWILNSHAHADHAGGIAFLQRGSGAQVLASAAGARELAMGGIDPDAPQYGELPEYRAIHRVRVVRDGEVLQLGDVAITAHDTPGHTAGSTSWT